MNRDEASLRTDIVWNSAGNIVYFALQWAILVVVARLSGYKYAWYLSLAISITNIFLAIASYGIRNFQVSDVDHEFENTTLSCAWQQLHLLFSSMPFLLSCVNLPDLSQLMQ